MKDIRTILQPIVLLFVLFFVCAISVAFAAPFLFEFFETATDAPLAFEGALRIGILYIHALMLLVALPLVVFRGQRVRWLIWSAFLISFLSLGVIFFGDRAHRLLEEYSWIRYTTSAFLFFAAAMALGILVREAAAKARLSVRISWALIAAGLVYAGLDEVLEVHEWLQRVLKTPGTDFVTEVYALLAIAVLLIFVRSGLFRPISEYRVSLTLLASGVFVYALSVFLDSFDPIILSKLRSLANVLTADHRFVMSDAWYLLWSVKNSTNGFEEVFEHTAALLFFLAFASILFKRILARAGSEKRSSLRARKGALGCATLAIGGTAALVVASLPHTFPSSALAQGTGRATVVASYFDGLFHTDELGYHPAQGVVVANEGRGNIYRLRGDRFEKISANLFRDTDSVAADASGVYIADGNGGSIVRMHNGTSTIVTSRTDGLVHPEGLALAGNDIYILDESQRSISRFTPEKKLEIWKPNHPDLKTPESIAYDQKAGRLLIGDDTTGAVFRADFKKSLEKIAEVASAEDIFALPDGTVLIADSAWGAVFRLKKNGELEKIIQLRRMYRDMQGVAADADGVVYVTTADGFGSTSFMPSALLKIEGIRL